MKKILFLIIVIISFISPSCTDLDEEIYSEIASSSFYTNDNEVLSGYLRAYREVANSYCYRIRRYQILGTDMACWPQKGRHGYDGGRHIRLHYHEFYPEEPVRITVWNELYGMIGYCNDVITNLEAVDFEAQGITLNKPQLIAEIRGLRAYVYFWLMDMWGNVPIVTKVGEPTNPPTEPRADVFQFIVDEVTAVYNDLPVKGQGEWYAKFTQGAADALLAKMYLNAEVYTGTAMYSQCITHCNNIINAGRYSLDPNWQDPFLVDNESSDENIFVYADHSEYGSGLLQQINLHYAHQNAYGVPFCWNGIVTEQGFYSLYEPEDHRIEQWLTGLQVVNGDTLLGTEEFAGQPLVLNPDMTGLTMTTGHEAVGARNVKYEMDASTDWAWNNDVPIFRYADILLMKAECLLRDGGSSTDALALVNQVRERAYEDNYAAYGQLSSITLDELLNERGREFAYEHWWRNDLIRFDKYVTMAWWDHVPSNDHNKEIFPIPSDALKNNPNLVQNPGY